MIYEPAVSGADADETHLKQADGHWWLFQFDGDWGDSGAVKDAMQAGISAERTIDLENAR